MNIGYARVSALDRNLDLQMQALRKARCKKVFREKLSGASPERPEFQRMFYELHNGDTVFVWKLDRLVRSTRDLLEITETIREAGARFQSLSEPLLPEPLGIRLVLKSEHDIIGKPDDNHIAVGLLLAPLGLPLPLAPRSRNQPIRGACHAATPLSNWRQNRQCRSARIDLCTEADTRERSNCRLPEVLANLPHPANGFAFPLAHPCRIYGSHRSDRSDPRRASRRGRIRT